MFFSRDATPTTAASLSIAVAFHKESELGGWQVKSGRSAEWKDLQQVGGKRLRKAVKRVMKERGMKADDRRPVPVSDVSHSTSWSTVQSIGCLCFKRSIAFSNIGCLWPLSFAKIFPFLRK